MSGISPFVGFLKSVYGPTVSGYICLATIHGETRRYKEYFFKWPEQIYEAADLLEQLKEDNNLYFCPQILGDPNYHRADGKGPRVKENVIQCPTAWSDLDYCDPDKLLMTPTVLIESSPGRHQALWMFEEVQGPAVAEEVSRRIAYYHLEDGADKTGWDLTQLLRVPFSANFKYDGTPPVLLRSAPGRRLFRVKEFEVYPVASRRTGAGIPLPQAEEIPVIEEPLEYLQRYRRALNPGVFKLITDEPEGSWSEPLWKLMMYLFEGGLEREEVFSITRQASCNKYERDGRPDEHLWNDVCRAYIQHMENTKAVVVPELEKVDLIDEEELARVRSYHTFVDRYIAWATGLGDAAPQYHQAGAFVILSALTAGRVSLPTSFGTIIPNLWFMLLADTTLTRKSTAMDIATDLLVEIDQDLILATDGSIEGLLQGLATRPGQPSIFLRDEFAGLLEAMTKKDYMAGMAEMLTKMYDGKFQKRVLRQQTIEIRDPVLILFAGGIRNRIQQLLTLDHVSSGFMPRFIFLTAESDVSRVRPLGPPIAKDMRGRDEILSEMRQIHSFYSQKIDVNVEGTGIALKPARKWKAALTPEAWARYGKFEAQLLDAGVQSDRPDLLTPVYSRLGVSTLKAATLLAASELPDDDVVVEEIHILCAIRLASAWREYAIDVINGVGTSTAERDIERIYKTIQREPGVSRSTLMQRYHLTARNADSIFMTLEQRQMVTANKYGRGTTYRPVRSAND